MVDFVKEAIRQLMGMPCDRQGKIVVTRYCFVKMTQWQLTTEAIADTFRNGFEVADNEIIQNYYHYSVGLIYRYDSATEKYFIITCWKYRYGKGVKQNVRF